MRIALCSDVYAPHVGGTEGVMLALCKEYINKGHSVAVFTQDRMCDNSAYDCKQVYPIYRTKSYKLPFYPMCPYPKTDRNFKKRMIDFCPDIIHSHTPFEIGRWASCVAKELSIPSVLTTHTYLSYINNQNAPFSPANPLHKILAYIPSIYPKHTSALYTVNTGVSEYVLKKEVRELYKVSTPVVLIKNGYDRKELLFDPIEYYKQNHSKSKLSLLFVGRIVKEKNICFSFAVCKKLKERGVPFSFRLIGDGDIPYFKNVANKLGISDSVEFTGLKEKEEISRLYASEDVLLFPSEFDADSLAVKESLACGLIVLAVNGSGTAEQIENGINGYALEKSDTLFADKTEQLYRMKTKSFESFLKMREGARNYPIPSWSEIAHEYINLYTKLINKEQL